MEPSSHAPCSSRAATSAVAWYRCALPGDRARLRLGLLRRRAAEPRSRLGPDARAPLTSRRPRDYDVVIVQQPRGAGWAEGDPRPAGQAASSCSSRSTTTCTACARSATTTSRTSSTKKRAGRVRARHAHRRRRDLLDEWLAAALPRVQPGRRTSARNGIDLKRYALTLPERDHVDDRLVRRHRPPRGRCARGCSSSPRVMRERDETSASSASASASPTRSPRSSAASRALLVPFTALDVYPSAMANYDIALAPAGETNFYRGKSDLRWLEAARPRPCRDRAIPASTRRSSTASPASTPPRRREMREYLELLADDRDLRRRVGAAAKAYVTEHRSAQVASQQWVEVLQSVVPATAACMSVDAVLARIGAAATRCSRRSPSPPAGARPRLRRRPPRPRRDVRERRWASADRHAAGAPRCRRPAGTPAGQAMVNLARQEVGVAEQPPGSNDSPRIAQYRQATAGSGVGPWCAYFVSWAARSVGAPLGDQGQGFGRVDDVWAWAQRTGKAIPARHAAAAARRPDRLGRAHRHRRVGRPRRHASTRSRATPPIRCRAHLRARRRRRHGFVRLG